MNKDSSTVDTKLLVVNQYYDPDVASSGQYLAELCSGLVARGFEVSVITGQPSYIPSSPQAPFLETLDGVTVHRVSLGKRVGRERMATRVLGYLKFMWRAWQTARTLVEREDFDTVLTLSNPPFVGLIGAYLASRHKMRYVYVITDIHPDIVVAAGWINIPPVVVKLWDLLNKWVLRRADTVVVLGHGMRKTLIQEKDIASHRVRVIPIWGRPELEPGLPNNDVRHRFGIDEEAILLLYAGNMGIMHPIEPILDAATLLSGLPVQFVFVGDGTKRVSLAEQISENDISQVLLLPYQTEDQFNELLSSSDACFVVLQNGMERFSVPSRAYTFLSAGKPIITIMAPTADVARLIKESGCGWNVADGDELATLIRGFLGNRDFLTESGELGRTVYEKRFRRECAIDQYAKLLTNGAHR